MNLRSGRSTRPGSAVTLAAVAAILAGCIGSVSPTPDAIPSLPTPTAATTQPAATPVSSLTGIHLDGGTGTPFDDPYVDRLIPTPSGFALLGSEQATGTAVLAEGSADGRGWVRLDPAPFGADITTLTGGPPGWIAATLDQSAAVAAATLWHSADGVSWEALPAGAGGTDAPAGVTASSAGPRGFIIAGDVNRPDGTAPAVWSSPDGLAWTEAAALEGAGYDEVLSMPSGFVAVSTDGQPSAASFSTDGRTWRDLAADAGSPFGQDGPLLVAAVGSTLVVVRYGANSALEVFSADLDATPGAGPVSWRHDASTDGVFAGAGGSAIVASSGGVIVLGYERSTLTPIAWTSPDGIAWHRTTLDPATFGGGVPAIAAGSAASGTSAFVAIGSRTTDAGDVRPQAWRSDDGTAWTAADGDLLGTPVAPPTGPCPATTPTTVDGLLAMSAPLWPACFGATTLSVRGYVADCGGCGGTTDQVATPSWLIDPLGFAPFWLSPSVVPAASGGGPFPVRIDASHALTFPPVNTHVEVTGHFDDPAATTCRVSPTAGVFGAVVPPTLSIARCRQAFVATAIRTIAP